MLDPKELKIETIPPPTDKGGQHVGVTYRGVKITHVPTGLVAECSFERNQFHNREIATLMIEYGLAEIGYGAAICYRCNAVYPVSQGQCKCSESDLP
jgi:protein subunit release factor A